MPKDKVQVHDCCFSKDGTRIVTAGYQDNCLSIWNQETFALSSNIQCPFPVRSCCAAFDSEKDKIVLGAGGLGRILLVHTKPNHNHKHKHNTTDAGDADTDTDIEDGDEWHDVIWDAVAHTGVVNGCSLTTTATLMASCSTDRTIQICDAANGLRVSSLSGHSRAVLSCIFSSGGTSLLSTSIDATSRLWDVEAGAPLIVLSGHSCPVNSGVFFPGESVIVTASHDKTIRLWDARTGKTVRRIQAENEVLCCDVCPRTGRVVSGENDGSCLMWDVTASAVLHKFEGHTGRVYSCQFSPTQDILLTSSDHDFTTRVWDSNSAVQINKMCGHAGWQVESSASQKPNRYSLRMQAVANKGLALERELLTMSSEVLAETDTGWVKHSRLVLLGEGGAGKTSLLAAMADKAWESPRECTAGASLMTVEVVPLLGGASAKWHNVTQAQPGELCGLNTKNDERVKPRWVALALAQLTAMKLEGVQHSNQQEELICDLLEAEMSHYETFIRRSHSPTLTSSNEPTLSLPVIIPPTPIRSSSPSEVNSTLMLQQNEVGLIRKFMGTTAETVPILLDAWDFGGQPVFNTMHHLFLTSFGVYVVVFDMRRLWQHATEKDRSTALEQLRFWLNCVLMNTQGARGISARAMLVGTHKDVVSDPRDHANISQLLQRSFEHNPAWVVVANKTNSEFQTNERKALWFFPVSNKAGQAGDPTLQRVMSEILRTARESEHVQRRIPLKWLQVIDQLNAEQREPWVPLEHVERIALQVGLPSFGWTLEREVEYILKLMHNFMFAMWHNEPNLRDFVIVDPTFLVDVFSKVICDHGGMHNSQENLAARQLDMDSFCRLRDEGVLVKRLLEALWHKFDKSLHNTLLALMELHGLVVPIAGESFLVPSLLPDQPAPATSTHVARVLGGAARHEFYFAFFISGGGARHTLESRDCVTLSELNARGFLPSGLFSKLLSKLVTWSYATTGQDTVSFGSGTFEVQSNNILGVRGAMPPRLFKKYAVFSHGAAKFVIIDEEEHGCVHIHTTSNNPLAIMQRVESQVREVVQECFRSLRYVVVVPLEMTNESELQLVNVERLIVHGNEPLAERIWTFNDQPVDAKVLSQLLQAWIGAGRGIQGLKSHYDVFLSYRWADQRVVLGMLDGLAYEMVGRELHAPVVFVDTANLCCGERLDTQFMEAMRRSDGLVPIVSWACLGKMFGLNENSPIDNVLLEWTFALELKHLGILRFITPVFLGPIVQHSSSSLSPSSPHTGKVMLNFFEYRPEFARSHHPQSSTDAPYPTAFARVPDVVVLSVVDRISSFLKQCGLKPSEHLQTRTARGVVEEICGYLGMEAWTLVKNDDSMSLEKLPRSCAQWLAHKLRRQHSRQVNRIPHVKPGSLLSVPNPGTAPICPSPKKQAVVDWLEDIGLGQYSNSFLASNVTFTVLFRAMTYNTLETVMATVGMTDAQHCKIFLVETRSKLHAHSIRTWLEDIGLAKYHDAFALQDCDSFGALFRAFRRGRFESLLDTVGITNTTTRVDLLGEVETLMAVVDKPSEQDKE